MATTNVSSADMGRTAHDAVLVDLSKSRRIPLSLKVDSPVTIGLKDGTVQILSEPLNEESQILFQIKLLMDGGGHWLYPKCQKCMLNDLPLSGPSAISHGSTIKADKLYFRYNITKHQKKVRRKLPQTPGNFRLAEPPPKPGRDPPDGEGTKRKSSLVVPLQDDELLHQIETAEQIGNLAGSYISRQVMYNTDKMLAKEEVDDLFRYLQEITESGARLLYDFVLDYNNQQRKAEDSGLPNHSPVIWLLTELLKLSMDPVEHNILWLKLLNTFSHFSTNFPAFEKYNTIAIVLGTMAAHTDNRMVQECGCFILAHLANYISPKGKIIIKSTSLELVTLAIMHFTGDVVILRPACRCIANLATTVDNIVSRIIDDAGEGSTELDPVILDTAKSLKKDGDDAVLCASRAFPDDLSIKVEQQKFFKAVKHLFKIYDVP